MENPKIIRSDLGAGHERKLEKRDFSNQFLENLDGKGVVYRKCDFSYSVFHRAYFHEAKFEHCKFVGARFLATNFRSATFEGCDFQYADFDRCVIPVRQILANLPTFANLRLELLSNIRANMRTLGDTRHESLLIWKEIDTEIEHWRAVSRADGGYYQKYTRGDRLKAKLTYWRLLAERYIWGHGESLTRLSIATFGGLALLGLMNAIGRMDNLSSIPIALFPKYWFESFLFVGSVYIDLPSVNAHVVADSPITSTLAVILRYASIGLAVPVLYKYISKR